MLSGFKTLIIICTLTYGQKKDNLGIIPPKQCCLSRHILVTGMAWGIDEVIDNNLID